MELGDVINEDLFAQFLAQFRDELDLTQAVAPVIHFDPGKHPRDMTGKFRAAITALHTGQSLKLPDGTSVKRTKDFRGFNEYEVLDGTSLHKSNNAGHAAIVALDHSAKKTDAKSLGGTTSHPSHSAAIKAMDDNKKKDERDRFVRKQPMKVAA